MPPRGRGRGGARGGRAANTTRLNADGSGDGAAVLGVRESGVRTLSGGLAGSSSSDSCGTCNLLCGNDAVGCDKCYVWFHPSSMCLGLPEQLVRDIGEYGGSGIAFICTDCRSQNDTEQAVDKLAFRQLFQTVRQLCETVSTLSEQMSRLVSGQQSSVLSRTPGDEDLRVVIREEMREMEERNKRKSSIIIRGMDVPTTTHLNEQFQQVATHLLSCQVPLSSVVCISREKKLYRAKVDDSDLRKKLLENAKALKNSPFSHIFINRDLTYQQRRELAQRRERMGRPNLQGEGGSSAALSTSPGAQATANSLN